MIVAIAHQHLSFFIHLTPIQRFSANFMELPVTSVAKTDEDGIRRLVMHLSEIGMREREEKQDLICCVSGLF